MIKLLIMDVDGTLTDGRIYLGNNGEEFKSFCVKDGMGIKELMKRGVVPVIMTGRRSKLVENRCMELGITHLYQNISDKISKMHEICHEMQIDYEEIAYIGDDINDLECLKVCGVSACPNDAAEQILRVVNHICNKKGGEGCVRELAEYIIRKNEDEEVYENSCNNAN